MYGDILSYHPLNRETMPPFEMRGISELVNLDVPFPFQAFFFGA
jgi:hypothetical protein